MNGCITVDTIIPEVRKEIINARTKYRKNKKTSDDTWLRVMMEEVGEVAALLDDEYIDEATNDRINEELIQVIAAGFNWLEFRNK